MAKPTLTCPACGAELRPKDSPVAPDLGRCPRCGALLCQPAPDQGLPRFLNLCARARGFNVRKKESRLRQRAFPGMVVASTDAFYLALDLQAPLGGGLFGAPRDEGGLFGTSDPLVEEAELAELPADVTGDSDWPLTWKRGPVLVVPRRAVRSLRTSLLLGGIELELADVRILVFTPVFRRQRMAAYLTATGWEVAGAKPVTRPPARDPRLPAAEVERGKLARARLVLGLLFLLIGLGLPLWQWKWLRSAMQGPAPVTLAELGRLDDPAALPNPWVSFRFDQALETGIETVDTGLLPTVLGTNRSRYLLIRVQGAWLIAQVRKDHTGNEVVGYLDRWQTPFARESLEKIRAGFPGLAFVPYQLDAYYAYRREAFSLLGLAGLLLLTGLLLVLFHRGRPAASPTRGAAAA